MIRLSSLSRTEVEFVMKAGVRKRGAFVTLLCTPFKKPAYTCVVSKKIFPKAHDRNTLKRRLRAITRSIFVHTASIAIIVRAEKSAARATHSELRDDLTSLFSDALNRMKITAYNQRHV